MIEADIVARLRRAWAQPASVPEDEMRVLISRAIEEIEALRVLRDTRLDVHHRR